MRPDQNLFSRNSTIWDMQIYRHRTHGESTKRHKPTGIRKERKLLKVVMIVSVKAGLHKNQSVVCQYRVAFKTAKYILMLSKHWRFGDSKLIQSAETDQFQRS